jgi:hypothetical protein
LGRTTMRPVPGRSGVSHNSHLTILARVEFPGLGLWLLLWLAFGVHLFRWAQGRLGGVRDPANTAAVWYPAAALGFLVGAYFDPSLEAPHAAVWLFTVVGLAPPTAWSGGAARHPPYCPSDARPCPARRPIASPVP